MEKDINRSAYARDGIRGTSNHQSRLHLFQEMMELHTRADHIQRGKKLRAEFKQQELHLHAENIKRQHQLMERFQIMNNLYCQNDKPYKTTNGSCTGNFNQPTPSFAGDGAVGRSKSDLDSSLASMAQTLLREQNFMQNRLDSLSREKRESLKDLQYPHPLQIPQWHVPPVQASPMSTIPPLP